MTVLGVLAVPLLWGVAAFSLCGISGCGGGGFGRTYSPAWVLVSLLLSGVAAAAGPATAARRAASRPAPVAAALLLLLVPVLGAVVVGARPDGYPRSVPREAREQAAPGAGAPGAPGAAGEQPPDREQSRRDIDQEIERLERGSP